MGGRRARGAAAWALVVGGAVLSTVLAGPTAAHRSGCHAAHTCPSDHHTYVWTDPKTGRSWDCVKPGGSEYDPSRDTTTIVWDGYAYECRRAGGARPQALSATPTATRLLAPRTKQSGCHVNGPLPDRRCSPGAIYADATLGMICRPGYSKRVRNVPESEKAAVYAEYGIPRDHYGRPYEVDHIVSLELGGSNDISNLYPEAAADPSPGFHVKDRLENRLHELVCAGKLKLAAVQREIARNWVALYETVFDAPP